MTSKTALLFGMGLLSAAVVATGGFYLSRKPLEGAVLRGLLFGGALGGINLVFGAIATTRALRQGGSAAMRTVLVGFFLRLVLLVGLVWWFQRGDWVDETAFALAFLVCFFVFLGIEMRLVSRSLGNARRCA